MWDGGASEEATAGCATLTSGMNYRDIQPTNNQPARPDDGQDSTEVARALQQTEPATARLRMALTLLGTQDSLRAARHRKRIVPSYGQMEDSDSD